MTTTQEQIEWLEGEKPFFDKKVQDMYSDIQRKLQAAEEMADVLLFYAPSSHKEQRMWAKEVSTDQGKKAQQSLKKWEGNNAN